MLLEIRRVVILGEDVTRHGCDGGAPGAGQGLLLDVGVVM